MDAIDIIIKRNEAEINEKAAKGLLVICAIVVLVEILCWSGVFDIYFDMTMFLLVAAAVTLAVPAVIVLKFHFHHDIMKYLIVTSVAVMAVTSYVLFTFQAVIFFTVPTLMAGFYMNKRLLYYSGAISVAAIILAHMMTGVYLRQPWLEPFTGMESILRYGALPRCLQYLGCFLLINLMTGRYMETMLHIVHTKESIPGDTEKKAAEEKEFERILQELTEREKSVFVLMVRGYTNMQIADRLCLSAGTVKNYISVIYEKVGSKERTALILKYHCFVNKDDESHIKE